MQVRGPILPTQPESGNPGLATPVLLKVPDAQRLVADEMKARREEEKAKRSAQAKGLRELDVKPIKADTSISSALNNAMAKIVSDVSREVASNPAYGDALRFLGDGVAPSFKNPEYRAMFEDALYRIQGIKSVYAILSNLGQRSIDIQNMVKSEFTDDTGSFLTESYFKTRKPDDVIKAINEGDFELAEQLVSQYDPFSFIRRLKSLAKEVQDEQVLDTIDKTLAEEYSYSSYGSFVRQAATENSTVPSEEIKKLGRGYTNPISGEFIPAESYTDLVTGIFLVGKKASTYGYPETAEGYDTFYRDANILLGLRKRKETLASQSQTVIREQQALTPGEGVYTSFTRYVGAGKSPRDLDNPQNYITSDAIAFPIGSTLGERPQISIPATDPRLVFQLGTDPIDAAKMMRAPVPSGVRGRIVRLAIMADPSSPTGYREFFEVETQRGLSDSMSVAGQGYDPATTEPLTGTEYVYVSVDADPTKYKQIISRFPPAAVRQRNEFIQNAQRGRSGEVDRVIRETSKTPVLGGGAQGGDAQAQLEQWMKTNYGYKYGTTEQRAKLLAEKKRELGIP